MKDTAKIATVGTIAIFLPLLGYWCFVTGREVGQMKRDMAAHREWLISADTSLTKRIEAVDNTLADVRAEVAHVYAITTQRHLQLEKACKACAQLRGALPELRHNPTALHEVLAEFPPEELCLPQADVFVRSDSP